MRWRLADVPSCCCLQTHASDAAFLQLSVNNILIAHGEFQAAQFDGIINSGLVVAEDVESLARAGAMPVDALTAESWITINKANIPFAAIMAAQRTGSSSGQGAAADRSSEASSEAHSGARGWSLGYSISSPAESSEAGASAYASASSLVFFFSLSVRVMTGAGEHVGQLSASFECAAPVCELQEWLHVVAIYNGTTASIHVNGKQRASAACTDLAADAVCGEISFEAGPGEDQELARKTPFVIGSLHNQRSGRSYTHVGAIKMARLYSRALAPDEIASQFIEGVQARGQLRGQPPASTGLWNTRVASDVYWLSSQRPGRRLDGSPTYNTATPAASFPRLMAINAANASMPTSGGAMVSSPSISSAGVEAEERIEVHGRFRTARRHRCRFALRHTYRDATVAFTAAYVSQEGRFEEAAVEYGSKLWCLTPVWHHGYRVLDLGAGPTSLCLPLLCVLQGLLPAAALRLRSLKPCASRRSGERGGPQGPRPQHGRTL